MEFLEQFFVMGLTLGRGDSSKSFRAFSLYVESYFHSVLKCHFHGFCKVFSLSSWGFHDFLLLSFFQTSLLNIVAFVCYFQVVFSIHCQLLFPSIIYGCLENNSFETNSPQKERLETTVDHKFYFTSATWLSFKQLLQSKLSLQPKTQNLN
jgi:hypothetical protein